MLCPVCKSKMHVFDSKPYDDNGDVNRDYPIVIERNRQCRNDECNYSQITEEYIDYPEALYLRVCWVGLSI